MQDADFRRTVLGPRGINFVSRLIGADAFAHFGTYPPSYDNVTYKDLDGCQHTEVWLTADDSFLRDINREYVYMAYERLCEAEFATYAKETLLRRDPRFLEQNKDKEGRVERMVEPSIKSDAVDPHDQWLGPPIIKIDNSTKEFDFDVRPDCQYWLSLRSFNPKYIKYFSDYVYVLRYRITCPYFTIEFKRDDGTILKAENQVAAVAAVALYSRCRLKKERLVQTRKRWTQKHTASLRHYGLTFAGPRYQLWWIRLRQDPDKRSITPKKWEWPGCEMVKAGDGDLGLLEDARTLVDWVNEIHRWGLGVHRLSCERDVQFCIANAKNTMSVEAAELDSDEEVDGEEG